MTEAPLAPSMVSWSLSWTMNINKPWQPISRTKGKKKKQKKKKKGIVGSKRIVRMIIIYNLLIQPVLFFP